MRRPHPRIRVGVRPNRRRSNRLSVAESPKPTCAEAIYPWYVLHQSLMIAVLFWLKPMQLGPWMEPALVLLGTVGGCLLLHELLIRRSRWLRPLFGLKSSVR